MPVLDRLQLAEQPRRRQAGLELRHGVEEVGLVGVADGGGAIEGRALHYPGMRAERLNEKDVLSELRLHGVDDMREVKLAVIEYNGKMSVIQQDWAEPVQKADVGLAMEEQKRIDTGGDDEPMPEHRTDSPEFLERPK